MSRRDHNPPAATMTLSPAEVALLVLQESYLFDQLERCREERRRLHDHEAERAKLRWDEDRRHEAEMLAAGLSRRPAPVRSKLGQTKHGVLWLIGQWTALAAILEANGAWKPAQVALAFDLLGVSKALREGTPWGVAGVDTARTLVSREIASLRVQLERTLEPLDAAERDAAESGYPLERSASQVRLQREETAYWRRLLALERRKGRPLGSEPVDEPAADDEPEPIEPEPPPPPSPATAWHPLAAIEPTPTHVRAPVIEGPPPLPTSARGSESLALRVAEALEAATDWGELRPLDAPRPGTTRRAKARDRARRLRGNPPPTPLPIAAWDVIVGRPTPPRRS